MIASNLVPIVLRFQTESSHQFHSSGEHYDKSSSNLHPHNPKIPTSIAIPNIPQIPEELSTDSNSMIGTEYQGETHSSTQSQTTISSKNITFLSPAFYKSPIHPLRYLQACFEDQYQPFHNLEYVLQLIMILSIISHLGRIDQNNEYFYD